MQLKNNRQRKNDDVTQPMPNKAGPRSSKGAAKREQILNDLMLALADGSLRNPSLREVGQALGIEPAHILYYFESREALLQAAIIRWDEDSRALVGKSDRNLQFTLEDYVAAVTHNIDRPGIVHLYLTFAAEAVDPAHPAHDFFQRRFERVRENLAAAVRQEQSNGRIANTHDPDLQARLFIALADGLQLQSLVDPQLNAAKDLGAALSILRGSDGFETNGAG
jgi:AcrR family transcriptional regulator